MDCKPHLRQLTIITEMLTTQGSRIEENKMKIEHLEMDLEPVTLILVLPEEDNWLT